jgi:signal transduction histidine kinase
MPGSSGAPARATQLRGRALLAARGLWIALALASMAVWALGLPVFYRSALLFQNQNCCVTRQPAEWLAGLSSLGLSPGFYAGYLTIWTAAAAPVMAGIATLIFLRGSDRWVTLFISLTLLGLGVTVTNNTLTSVQAAYPGWGWAVWAYAQLPYFAFFAIPLVFPDGRFVPRWTVGTAAVLALFAVANLVTSVVSLPSTGVSTAVSLAALVFVVATVLGAPIYRYLRVSDRTQREQTKWVVFALVPAIAVFAAAGLIGTLVPWSHRPPSQAVLYDLLSFTLTAIGFAFVAVAFAIAILRYRLWDIDLIINRALVYLALTVCTVGLYVLVVGGIGQVLRGRASIFLSLVAAGLIAVLFQPLRLALQRAVNRLMYGRRDEPYAVISGLGHQLQGTLTPEAVLPTIVRTVADALRLPYAAIELTLDDGQGPRASVGTLAGEPYRIPLLHQGECVGQLTLGRRPGETAFSSADRRLLQDLAHQAGVAARGVLLVADLQRSRELLVTTREEERRRLRGDLHDGLGPALASMAMQAELARELLLDDPSRADPLLAELTQELQDATAEIRRLAHELRPPALDDLGLVGALRSQMSRFERSGTLMTLEASDPLPPLSAAVEVAVYRIVLESLHNVIRHAAAASCRVTLTVDEAAQNLRLEVTDDGRGLPSRHLPGVGLSSMRERAAELGGTCDLEQPATGGTRLLVRIPLAQSTAAQPFSSGALR